MKLRALPGFSILKTKLIMKLNIEIVKQASLNL